MKQKAIILLCFVFLLTSSHCDNEEEPTDGHFKLKVTYPELVNENGKLSIIQVPTDDAVARLYNKDAICKGFKDASLDIVWIGEENYSSLIKKRSNELGEIIFADIEAGEYFLIVYAAQLYRYTEKYIMIPPDDTLKLNKNFSNASIYHQELEPWDYVMPPL